METKVSEKIQELIITAPDDAIPYIIKLLSETLRQKLECLPGTIAWNLADKIGYDLYHYGLNVQSPETRSYWNRYSAQRTRQSFMLIWKKLGFESWQGKRVLDLGAGEYVPASLSLVAVSHGVDMALAVDPSPIVNIERSLSAYEELVKDILYVPEQYCHSNYQQLHENIYKSDSIKCLKTGTFNTHCAADFLFLQSPVNEIPQIDNVDIVWAFSVLEHIENLTEACHILYQMTKKGGRHFYTIDFTDHRRYVDSSFGPWDFLCDQYYSGDQNRLRFTAVRNTFEQAGFRVIYYKPVAQMEIDNHARDRLLPEFTHISDQELSILNAHLVVEKK